MQVSSSILQPFYPSYPLYMRQGGPQNRSGYSVAENAASMGYWIPVIKPSAFILVTGLFRLIWDGKYSQISGIRPKHLRF
jgi:hypothetical protein